MAGIAQGARNDQAKFYWHLGDFRATYDFDEDILAAPEYRSKHLAIAEYQSLEWRDFIAQQIEPFGDTPVFLAIGNHELVPPKTRADYIQQFADWLDSPVLRTQRLKDDRRDHQLHTYYHWIQGGVDFVSLDNASKDQFDDEQIAWVERTLTLDESNTDISSVVVGMHDALPDSISAGHSMNESAQMERSGRRIYQDLQAFRSKTKKNVYVLASHSHFVIEDVYHDACHSSPNSVLPGWIVGTARSEASASLKTFVSQSWLSRISSRLPRASFCSCYMRWVWSLSLLRGNAILFDRLRDFGGSAVLR